MKYHLIVANPLDYGFTPENTKMCTADLVPLYVDELAGKYPNETIIEMKPNALYKTKYKVETTKFNINDKMEIIPA